MELDRQKIMMFSSVHPYQDARIYHKEAMTLAHEYQVDFYAVETGHTPQQQHKLSVHLLPKRKRFTRFLNIDVLKKAIKKSQASFYHFHDPELLLLVPFIRKHKKGAIIIYDMHENFPQSIETKNWLPKKLRKSLATFIKKKEQYYLQLIDGVIFAEASYEKYYSSLPVKKVNIYNYPPYIHKLNKQKTNEAITFIYVGRIAAVRGIFDMLELIRQLKKEGLNVCLKLIGMAESHVVGEIKSFVSRNQLQDCISYMNYIDYSEIWYYYERADIGLCVLHPIPNYLESLATKLFEYMAAEIPVIASNFPKWQTLVNESHCGMVIEPRNIKEMKQAAYKLMDEKVRQRLGANGRAHYEAKYNWKVEAEKLLTFYRKWGGK